MPDRRIGFTSVVDLASCPVLGAKQRLHFILWTDDVPTALADLDVVALSTRNEGTPVAHIGALAFQRPVVATDVGGVSPSDRRLAADIRILYDDLLA
jgi:glycosyltransferase involved in cell wall biosynthesis